MKKYLLHTLLGGLAPLTFIHAQSASWDDGGIDSNWNTDANWSTDTVPTAQATFSGNLTDEVTLSTATDINNIRFDNVGTWTFSGSDLTILAAPVSSGTRPFYVSNAVNVTFNNTVVFDKSAASGQESINFDVNAAGSFNFAGGIQGNSSVTGFAFRTANKLVTGSGLNATIGSLTDISTFEWRTANSVLNLNGASSVDTQTRITPGLGGNVTVRLGNNGALGTGEFYLNHSGSSGAIIELQATGADRTFSNAITFDGGYSNGNLGLYKVSGDNDLSFSGTANIEDDAEIDVVADRTFELSGNVIGDSDIIKVGDGVMVLSGATIGHSGNTTVEAGTLLVNGSFSLALTPNINVTDTGVLGGTGSMARDVVFTSGSNGGGVLNPGLVGEIGTLTINGGTDFSLTLASDTELAFDIGAGGAVDLIDVSGDLVLDGILNLNDLGLDQLGSYTIVSYGGALTNNGLTLGSGPSGWTYDLEINETSKEVILNVTAIPEPSVAQLLMGAAAMGYVLIGRRRQQRGA